MNVKSSEIPSSKIEVCDNSGNENLSVPTLPIAEVTTDQHSEAKAHETVEASKTDTSIVDTPTNSLAGSTTIEIISKPLDHVTAKIVPAILNNVYPSTPGSGSTHPSLHESLSSKRQGRKTQNRVEPPRRRGRKSASVLPVVPDALSGQDLKLSHHAQNSSGDALEGKSTTNVTQTQAIEILLPSGVASQDSKRKERASNSTQNKQQKAGSTRADSATVSSDKIAAFGRIHNVNDVARVMKEVFSGTCLPKPKAHDSLGSEDRNPPIFHVVTKAAVDAGSNCSLEEKACADGNVAVDGHEKQSDMQNLKGKASLDASTAFTSDKKITLENDTLSNVREPETKCSLEEKACSDGNVAVDGHEKQSELASDMQNLKGIASLDTSTAFTSDKKLTLENDTLLNVREPETKCYVEVEEKTEQPQQCIKNPTTQSIMEVLDTTLNAAQISDGPPERLPTGCGPTIYSSVVSPSAKPLAVTDHNLGNQSESSEKCSISSPLDIGGTGGATNPLEPENFNNNPEFSKGEACRQSNSSTNEHPNITEHTSNKKLESSEPCQKSSPLACGDNTGLLAQAENLSDQPQVTICNPAEHHHLRTMIISEHTEINSRNETESSSKASDELSVDEGIDGCKTSASADCDRDDKSILSPTIGNLKGEFLEAGHMEMDTSNSNIMENDMANRSGVQEEPKVDDVETDVQMDSSTSQNMLVNRDAVQENVDLPSCLMESEENIEGPSTRTENTELEISKMSSDSPITVNHSVESELLSVKGKSSEVEVCDQIDAHQVFKDDLERLTSKDMDVSSLCSPLAQDKPSDPLILEDSCRNNPKVCYVAHSSSCGSVTFS